VQETSILEPEAAVYLLHRRPGCLLLYVSPQQWGRYAPLLQAGAGSGPGDDAAATGTGPAAASGVGASTAAVAAPQQAPLTLQQLWALFCGRIPNFPARYGVYKRFRDGGWVVREGSIFGADFVLYAKGPGWDHAPHCITVTPLRLAVEAGDGAAAAPAEGEAKGSDNAAAGGGVDAAAVIGCAAGAGAGRGGAVGPAAAAAPLPALSAPSSGATAHTPSPSHPPAPRIRAPARPALGNWVEVHAVGRVIGNVRKHNVAAYVTLPVPRGAAEAAEAAGRALEEDEAEAAKRAEEGEVGLAQARSCPAAEGSSTGCSSGGGGPFYPAPIAALLATPDCADALQVQTLLLSRWHITADMTRKASAMMARAALAVTRAQAADEGLHIDLGLLEGQRSSLEAAHAANAAAKADARERRAAKAAAAGAAAGDAAAETGEGAGSAAAGEGSAAAAPGSAQAHTLAQQQHQVVNKSLVKAQVRALLAKQHTAAAPAPAGGSGSAGAGSSDGAAGGAAAGKKGGKGGHGPQFAHPSVHPILLFPSYDEGRPGAANAAATAVLAYEQQLLRSCPQWNPGDAANELYRNPYGRGLGGGFGSEASSLSAGGAAGVGGAADAGRQAAACASSLTALPPDADATLLRLHAEACRAIDAAAARPASAAHQALLEAARRQLVRTGSDSLAGSAAGSATAGAGSAAVPEVRSRGWYVHSREWTKLRAS
jgi:hypothetical protein